MTIWLRLNRDRDFVLYAPIAFRLVDAFTGASPFTRFNIVLERQDGPRWSATGLKAFQTVSGIISYSGLGRAKEPARAPVERYRVRMTDEEDRMLYRPAYRYTLDGLEFDVSPWNDTEPPAASPNRPETVYLLPGTNYPFSSAVPVLRGRAIDEGGRPLADARISTGTDYVLSDERGAFSLPIRLTAPIPSIAVVGEHARTGVNATVTVPLSTGLVSAIELQLT